MSQDEPTDEMPGGPDEPTEVTPAGDDPTGNIPKGNEDPTDVIPEGGVDPSEAIPKGNEKPAEAMPGAGPGGAGPAGAAVPVSPDSGGSKGIGVLVASIAASLLLVGIYIVAGGLDNGPDKAADPCDARPWTNPQNVEEAAQQFALSAADGAACELGVSREELTRSIADDQARQDFMDEHGFSETDLEDALRSGLNRAVDDAENAGALSALAAVGIRAAIRVMPMSVMIDLLENADSIFNSDLGGVGDAIDAITGGVDGLDELGTGGSGDPLKDVDLGQALEGVLPDGTTDALEGRIPDDLQRQLEDEAKERLEQGLNDLLGP